MPQHLRAAASAALFFHATFATGTAAAPPAPEDTPAEKVRSRPKVGIAEKVTFSEFDKDSGALVVELGAATARPVGAVSKATGEPEAWSLGKVSLRLYDRGTPFGTITTPDCHYVRATRTASSPRDLEFDNEDFRVDGTNWSWRDEGGRDLIIIRENIRATLKEKPTANRERTDIFSDRLDIIYHKSGTPEAGRVLFVFSGNVRAVMKDADHGDVMLFGDTLVVRLKNSDARAAKTANGKTPATSPIGALGILSAANTNAATRAEKEARLDNNLENIVVSGNVRISSEGREMTGDLTSYDQATRIFITTGRAFVSDQSQALTAATGQVQGFAASGGQMLWRRKENKIEVFREPAQMRSSTTGASVAAGGTSAAGIGLPGKTPSPPVRLQIPSFADQKRPGRVRYGDGFTTLTGEYLVIEMKPTANFAEMRGNVHATDEDFVMDAGRILVETPAIKATSNMLGLSTIATAPDTPAVAAPTSNPSKPAAPGKPAASGATTSATVTPDFQVRHITATESVRADYEGRKIRCEKAVISPEKETITLTGNPLLETEGASLRGYAIEMDIRKEGNRSIVVRSSPPAATGPRQNVQVALPALHKPATPGKSTLFDTPTQVSANHVVMREVDREKNLVEFDFTGGVKLNGGGLNGHCDRLGVLANVGGSTPATKASPVRNPRLAPLARIHKLTAIGNVLFGTKEYTAEGGEAIVLPSVTVRERSPLDDNGLDGPAPQFLTLHPHDSTPGKRPRLTFFSETGLRDIASLDGAASGKPVLSASPVARSVPSVRGDTIAPITPAAPSAAGKPAPVPYHLDGDTLEVIGGAMRSRFFLRGNVVLTGPDLSGSCDAVEGSIIQETQAKRPGKAPDPDYVLTQVIGRGNVRVTAQGRLATGEKFEFLPVQDKLYLTGSPSFRDKGGLELRNATRIIFNRKTGEWESDLSTDGNRQVPRPSISVPLTKKFLP